MYSARSAGRDRKSTRLNSSHTVISYAVFCLKRYHDHQILHSFPTRRSSDLKILRPVRKKHHEGHKNDKIGKTLPFSRDDTQNLPGARGAMLLPRFRLRHFRADVQREKRRQRTDPEHGAPSPCRQEKSRGNRGEQVADGITALQNPAEDSPPAHWRCFHRERRAHSPFAAHADAEQRAQDDKHSEVRRKAAEKLDDRKIDHVGHERDAAPVTVREKPE